MKKKSGIIIGIVIILAVAFGLSKLNSGAANNVDESAKTVTVIDRKGEVTVPLNPKNVVVLDLSSLEILQELGVEPAGLPKGSLTSYLDKYNDEKYADIGTVKEYDLEKIASLNPEVIIIENRQQEGIDELSKIAPVLFLGTDTGKNMESLERNLKALGTLFDQTEAAEQILADYNSRIEAINSKVTEKNETALFVMVNEGELSVYGEGSRFGFIYNPVGFAVADETIESSTHGQNVTSEYVKEKNPAYIFVMDRGAVVSGTTDKKANEVMENELIKTTDAYKKGHIYYVDSEAWYLGGSGVISVDKMISDMEKAIK